jgi:hypothetical protein
MTLDRSHRMERQSDGESPRVCGVERLMVLATSAANRSQQRIAFVMATRQQ